MLNISIYLNYRNITLANKTDSFVCLFVNNQISSKIDNIINEIIKNISTQNTTNAMKYIEYYLNDTQYKL